MTAAATIPCTVAWCQSDRHPDRDRVSHRAIVGVFAGGAVTITLAWLERLDDRPSMGPALRIRRGDASTVEDVIDAVPGEARLWAEILGALDVAETLQFARALLDGAAVLEDAGADQ